MLDVRFARIPGDMGNAPTWPFPVLYWVVRGATLAPVVLEGAEAITTKCGFLSLFLAALAAHAGVLVATSARHVYPMGGPDWSGHDRGFVASLALRDRRFMCVAWIATAHARLAMTIDYSAGSAA